MPRKKTEEAQAPETKAAGQGIEENFARLEEIIKELEAGDRSLEETFTKEGESLPPNFLASSTASLTATFSGTALSSCISYKAWRRIVSSTFPMRRVFHPAAAWSIA